MVEAGPTRQQRLDKSQIHNAGPRENNTPGVRHYCEEILPLEVSNMTVWPSGLRRWLQAPARKGVGSNPTAVSLRTNDTVLSCTLTVLDLRC